MSLLSSGSSSGDVYLVAPTRTPIGAFLGSLSSVPAPQLGAAAIAGVMKQSGLPSDAVDEVLMGCVLPAGQRQAPARQAMIHAGLPTHTGAVTINKVCGSGLKTVMMAANAIRAQAASVIMAGGMESMSQAPYYLNKARQGLRMGHETLQDGMILDGLWDPYQNFHMGQAGELCAQKYGFSREAQDAYAQESTRRAKAASDGGLFRPEITPVSIAQRKGDPVIVDRDEQPDLAKPEKIPTLRPVFQPDGGTITAGNASSINDGAAAVLVVSDSARVKYALKPVAKILGVATFSQAPEWFTTAPVKAIEAVLKPLSLPPQDIDLYEINEAFAVVAMAAIQDLNLSPDQVNIHGGAVALGHPIGASGCRILVTLAHALVAQDKRLGLATLCIGGGEAVAVVIERV